MILNDVNKNIIEHMVNQEREEYASIQIRIVTKTKEILEQYSNIITDEFKEVLVYLKVHNKYNTVGYNLQNLYNLTNIFNFYINTELPEVSAISVCNILNNELVFCDLDKDCIIGYNCNSFYIRLLK